MIFLCNNMYTKYLKKCAIFSMVIKKSFFVLNLVQQYIYYIVKKYFIALLWLEIII